MTNSILDSVKKTLGLAADYTAFDTDIILYINSVFSTLTQIGVGPEDGYSISSSSSTWDAFVGTDKNLNSVKSYVCLKVRLLFDPPTTSFAITAIEEMIKEAEWRIYVYRDNLIWTSPEPETLPEDLILDGGSP